MNTRTFTGDSFKDLVVGQDIGVKSFNKKECGVIHNKDVSISYVKDGQRYYVSLMNSMNMHGGSMYYQANHMLVIKETEPDENGVYFTVLDRSTKGMVEHAYGDLQMYLPETAEHGYCYRECSVCGKQDILGEAHYPGEWIVDRALTDEHSGLQHRLCVVCGALAESAVVTEENIKILNHSEVTGRTFRAFEDDPIPAVTTATPFTYEVTLKLPTTMQARAGVLLGTYTGGDEDQMNLEVYSDGKLRLFYVTNGTRVTHLFNTDVRSDEAIRLALTVEDTLACVYINGVLVETVTLPKALPEGLTSYVVGGDHRSGNAQYFRGTIYDVAMYADARTAEEIALDAVALDEWQEDLLYVAHYTRDGVAIPHTYSYFCDEDCNVCGFVHKADAHTYDTICDEDCNVCGLVRTSGVHSFDSDCDPECNVCGVVREVSDHVYSGVCDPDCDSCGTIREAEEHTYDNACDADCNVCGGIRVPSDHVYDNVCDATCNVCGNVREDIHLYSGVCDTDCNECGEIRETEPHTYTDATDTECNGCGFIRVFAAIVSQPRSVCGDNGEEVIVTVEAEGDGLTYAWYFAYKGSNTFLYTATFTGNTYFVEMNSTRSGRRVYCVITDAYGNSVQTDTVTINMLPHIYDNACDDDCNVCGDLREVAGHAYDNACDADCNVCGAVRVPADHVYDNVCDADCNVCGDLREVDGHAYDNACDADCNHCGTLRDVPGHNYVSAGHTDATCGADGSDRYACTNCGDEYVIGIPATGEHIYGYDYDVECDVCGQVRTVDLPVSFGGNSISEDVSGLAFKFDIEVLGMEVDRTTAIYDNANVGGYKLLDMGALVSNGTMTLDVKAVYLFEWDETWASYAVRIINIPTERYDAAITATPYFVIEVDGQAVTVYGEPQTQSFNGVLNG